MTQIKQVTKCDMNAASISATTGVVYGVIKA